MTILSKKSRRYDPFIYWWDISPRLASKLSQYDTIEFVKKDTGDTCSVSVEEVQKFLISNRQTSRGEGNWGIKILADHPNELAFEPGDKNGEWLFLSVVWKPAQ